MSPGNPMRRRDLRLAVRELCSFELASSGARIRLKMGAGGGAGAICWLNWLRAPPRSRSKALRA